MLDAIDNFVAFSNCAQFTQFKGQNCAQLRTILNLADAIAFSVGEKKTNDVLSSLITARYVIISL